MVPKLLYYFLCQFHHALSIFAKVEFQKLKYPNHMYISFVLFSSSLHLENKAVSAVSATGFVPIKIEILITYLR